MRVLLLEEARRQLEAEDDWWRANRDHPEVVLEDFAEVLRDLMKIPEAGQTYRRTGGKRIQRVLMKRARCHVYYFHDLENDTIEIHSSGARTGDAGRDSDATEERRMRLRANGDTVDQPTWEQIEDALNALDGDARSFIALERGLNDEHIGVGGGADDLVLLYWELPGESSETALRPAGDWSEEDEVCMVVAGQGAEVPMLMVPENLRHSVPENLRLGRSAADDANCRDGSAGADRGDAPAAQTARDPSPASSRPHRAGRREAHRRIGRQCSSREGRGRGRACR